MKNVHARSYPYPPEAIRPWLEAVWSGTERDAFPRDVIRSWRRNPTGADALALIPGQTSLGHGGFSFRLTQWDGSRWRVEFDGARMRGWHGFDLQSEGGGARLTHTFEAGAQWPARLVWRWMLEPIHDWVVEALLDRLAIALRTGRAPERTERPMGLRASAAFKLAKMRFRRKARRRTEATA